MKDAYNAVLSNTHLHKARLIAVSKRQPLDALLEMYHAGQRDFGENRVQELMDKLELLPKDIRWHFIGHLQRNKVKYLAPFVHMIHSVDTVKLAREINREAKKNARRIPVLLEVKIASEETKHGFSMDDLKLALANSDLLELEHIDITGLMAMATFTKDQNRIRVEFKALSNYFKEIKAKYFENKPTFSELSIGMSSDYKIALEEGSTMVRVGSLIFGPRAV
jgi:pyridoxal phosphate enzyme (YggS family)